MNIPMDMTQRNLYLSIDLSQWRSQNAKKAAHIKRETTVSSNAVATSMGHHDVK